MPGHSIHPNMRLRRFNRWLLNLMNEAVQFKINKERRTYLCCTVRICQYTGSKSAVIHQLIDPPRAHTPHMFPK